MKQPRVVRSLTDEENAALEEGLSSRSAFTLRRCQILLASARGESTRTIAHTYGSSGVHVRSVIMDFHSRGITCIYERTSNQSTPPTRLDQTTPHAETEAKYKLLKPHLKDRSRRLWAAAEALMLGHGGIKRVAAATGLSPSTIAAGMRELNGSTSPAHPRARPIEGGRVGRRPIEHHNPAIVDALERLLADEVAGDPMTEQKWVRSSLRRLSQRLQELGHRACPCTVRRLLRKLGFSLKVNMKSRVRTQSPERDEQFRYIASQRTDFASAGLPIISVDTKKKELIGEFLNKGRVWCRQPTEVNRYDFSSGAECLAVPYGIYDVTRNTGFVVVGVSHNTPEFAVSAIARWWEEAGRFAYPTGDRVLILADGGGGNGSRSRAWKLHLQEKLSDRFGLTLTVCHYPPGCSKWNPVEYKLFSQISVNWAGRPLKSLRMMLGYMRGTTTKAGLAVKAVLDEGIYKKGQNVTRDEAAGLSVQPHDMSPTLNYSIYPRRRVLDRS